MTTDIRLRLELKGNFTFTSYFSRYCYQSAPSFAQYFSKANSVEDPFYSGRVIAVPLTSAAILNNSTN